MPDSPTFDSLADLLAELRAEPRQGITPATRLREDLQIEGDDWDEVLMELDKRWPVDWSGFEFYRFFHEEPNWLMLVRELVNLIRGHRLKSLTVGHLALVLERGSWFDPGDAAA